MRIKKYDYDYSRRVFLDKVAKGAGAGVLAPLWPMIGNTADISKAYPDELLHIEAYTKGKIKPGDQISSNNVDVVKELLDPICYVQIKEMGRKIWIKDSNRDVTKMFNSRYLELTLKNAGRAKFGPDGNLWTDGKEGNIWIGGMPFPDPKTAAECCADISTSWGRHDYSQYAIPIWALGPDGNLSYRYDLVWFELQTTGRNDGKVLLGRKDLLRLNTALFASPQEQAGASFLSTWYYDQRKFPDLYGYLPQFRRVRQFPTNQRFEPLVPGINLFLSDAWGAGDPMLTWGNFKIVGRQPMLGACSGSHNWYGGKDPEWHAPFHGGAKGNTFTEKTFELIPEAIVWDSEPVGYPRAPVGLRKTYTDARNGTMITQISYDRRGKLYKQTEFATGQLKNDKAEVLDAQGHPDWSWNCAQFHDIQTNRMTHIRLARSCAGGYKSEFSDAGQDVYNKFCTNSALQRLGTV